MAVWAHFILPSLLYLADGKPKLPGGATNKNLTDVIEINLNQTENVYHFDYNLFKNKSTVAKPTTKPHRFARRIIRENIILDDLEVKFDWNNILVKDRIGALFILKKEDKTVENAILYQPNDEMFTVRGIKEGLDYLGEVRLIRNNETLANTNQTRAEDIFSFTLEAPRIISENEVDHVMEAIKNSADSKIKVTTITVNFRLPNTKDSTVMELTDISDKNDKAKVVVHIASKMVSLVVNDLPSSTVMRVNLKSGDKVFHSSLIFTGTIVGPSHSSRPTIKNAGQTETDDEGERLTVKCFVKDKPPFQGFPCKGSTVCVPLHWECDGEDDCPDGFDESRCDKRRPAAPAPIDCKGEEFSCISKTIPVCLPINWLCDGREDCLDGFDEKKENCREPQDNITTYSFCDREHFKCHRGGCVIKHRVCDGYKDCSDGSDEFDCPDDQDGDDGDDDDDDDFLCDQQYEFTCDKRSPKRRCIPRPWVCDDQDDCPFGEDETDYVCRSHYHNYFDKKREAEQTVRKSG